KDLILDESLQDSELYPELIQPSLLSVLQCKVLPGTREGMGWNQPAFLITVSLVHTCIQTGESRKGWYRGTAQGQEGDRCFLQDFDSASVAVKINSAPGYDCLFQHCPVENYL
ncbi:hypothetical protein N326_12538, partial [Eurypyga helias]